MLRREREGVKGVGAARDEFRSRGAAFVTELSAIDEGRWGFEVADADGYVLAFACLSDRRGADGAPPPAE